MGMMGEILRLAFWGVWSYRFRVFLLSVTLGVSVASVVLTAAIGAAFEEEIHRLSFGAYSRSLVVSENVFAQDNVGPPTLNDYRSLSAGVEFEGQIESAAAWRSSVVAIRTDEREANALLLGVTGAYRAEADMPIVEGRHLAMLETTGSDTVCLIGHELKARLFDDENVVGKRLNLNGVLCEIVGVLGRAETRTALRFSNAVVTPFSAASRYFRGSDSIGPGEASWMTITFTSDQHLQYDEMQADRFMRRSHGVSQARVSPFQFADPGSPAASVRYQQRLITGLLAGVSVITVCAGLVGYGAIVWGMTQVRRRSIAILMTCGFQPWEVVSVFMAETLIAGALGGGVGLLIAAVGAELAETYLFLDATIEPWLGMSAVGLGLLSGAVAGALPALAAASTQPALAARD